MNKIISVFGSSKPVQGEEEYETAHQLGKYLGERKLDVCTGGYKGIMDAVSKGAVEAGSNAIGVTVDIFNSTPSKFLTENIICHTLFQRIETLVRKADGFIVLRGGTGTLLELSTVWELMNKHLEDSKPIACHGKMWIPIINSINERLDFEGKRTDIVKSFKSITDCADYVISNINL